MNGDRSDQPIVFHDSVKGLMISLALFITNSSVATFENVSGAVLG